MTTILGLAHAIAIVLMTLVDDPTLALATQMKRISNTDILMNLNLTLNPAVLGIAAVMIVATMVGLIIENDMRGRQNRPVWNAMAFFTGPVSGFPTLLFEHSFVRSFGSLKAGFLDY